MKVVTLLVRLLKQRVFLNGALCVCACVFLTCVVCVFSLCRTVCTII